MLILPKIGISEPELTIEKCNFFHTFHLEKSEKIRESQGEFAKKFPLFASIEPPHCLRIGRTERVSFERNMQRGLR